MGINARATIIWGFPLDTALSKRLDANWEMVEDTVKDSGCLVTAFGCCFDRCFVAIEASEVYATDWISTKITPTDLKVSPDWESQLAKFCALLDIPWEEPCWYLLGGYG
jgi:hypothetical protein